MRVCSGASLSAVRERACRPSAYLRAAFAAAVAALRLAHLETSGSFDHTVARLRRGRAFPPSLSDPALHLRTVNRLLLYLPPWRMGRCLKRSLLLVHLWSRCGLHPRLHLGMYAGRGGHAWITAGSVSSGPVGTALEVTTL